MNSAFQALQTYLYAARDVRNDIMTIDKLTSGKKIDRKSVKNHMSKCYSITQRYNIQARPTMAFTRSLCSSSSDDPP